MSALANEPRQFRPAGRVAVFQPRPGLGDLIWHLPIIRAIADASEGGKITLVTKPSTQADALLAGDPAIERIAWFDRNPRQGRGRHDGPLGFPRLVATLRACRADSCVLLHHGASLAAAMALAGISHRYAYGYSRSQRLWLNHKPTLAAAMPFTEAFDQAAAFAKAAGLWPLPEASVGVQAAALQAVCKELARAVRPIAVLGIGSHGADRQWGTEKFAALAAGLLQTGIGTILLAMSANEAGLAQAISHRLPPDSRVRAAIGWPLADVAALLWEADLFVGNDSGLMNLRASLGRPAYALFGASGPLRHSSHIRPVIPPAGPRAGMAAITVGQVLDTVAQGGRNC